ncbi:CHAD domain-containing protein [Rhodopseudomonas palustris]|nr:CHAD domain-containing protein [Rhodopseudomonas palustris]QLH73823.1 CHAD domain-containing protein [Rhodopseudomonas palustris]RHZ97146.1 CHAD domain-containing protein [Rhodopseudomonas palustris]WBU31089.1 CHAD domain-containing protein [Rhodopseudomonas palustris]
MRRVLKKRTAKPGTGPAHDIVLSQNAGSAEAFRAIATELLRLTAAQQPKVRRRDPTGVHQMRIALRRMRAAISVFGELIEGRDTQRLKRELKWLAGRLAPARDLHLLEVKIKSAQLGTGSPAFLKRLGSDRGAAFASASATVELQRFRKLMSDLQRWIDAGEWTRGANGAERPSAAEFGQQVLARRARKLNKRLEKLEQLDDEERHQVRIAAKKLNYAIGFFESLFDGRTGKRLERFRKHLKKLLDALGALNDVAVHRKLAGKFSRRATAKLDPDAARQLADLDDVEIRQQMKAAAKAAAKLAEDPLFGD